ncbi:HAD family hydrolase [Methanofollis formosanus]|uniref:HAD family hydrolase n=1 Tax=Methanofollis formosanus TaxID=299308 RepID=A0A8G1EHL4_9EURY|nr:HAD family hydrolase [Methanofollis formosanus]
MEGVLFDCYDTLLDVSTDERSLESYRHLCIWAAYQGVRIDPEVLRDEYRQRIGEAMEAVGGEYPEVRVEDIFAGICRDYAVWPVDTADLSIHFARSFRAATARKVCAFPRTRRLLSAFDGYRLGIVSNGQRVFSEIELRMFGLYPFFDTVVFSSDIGCKKPDRRIFFAALGRLGITPQEALFIGDSRKNDLEPSRALGMQTLHIKEAWDLFVV